MPTILMYATRSCPFCVSARRLLADRGLEYTEILVDVDPDKRLEMMQRSNRRTVPQIFIGEHHVGGFDDLSASHHSGELDKLLEQV